MWIPNNRFMREDGIEDSYEKAMAYMEATAGTSQDAPGTSPARRATYVREAPKMVDFLVSQGVSLHRVSNWPDYHDERPGGSAPGRTVVAEMFDAKELGRWRKKLRGNYLNLPGSHEEFFAIATFRHSWHDKWTMFRVYRADGRLPARATPERYCVN